MKTENSYNVVLADDNNNNVYLISVGSGCYWVNEFIVIADNEQSAVDALADSGQIDHMQIDAIWNDDGELEIDNEIIFDDEYFTAGNCGYAYYHHGHFTGIEVDADYFMEEK